MKKYLCISLLTLALTACGGSGKSDEPAPVVPVNPERAMSFAAQGGVAASSHAASRASELKDTYTLFRVWTYKTTSSSNTETVMPGYQVKWLDAATGWQYDGTTYTSHTELSGQYLKYWDESATQYDFRAIAPWPLPDGVTATVDADGYALSDIPAHSATSSDVLVAHQRRELNGAAPTDRDMIAQATNAVQPEVYYNRVPLVFHRILTKVHYRIYNTGNKRAVINDITIGFDDGTYAINGTYTQSGWTGLSTQSSNLLELHYVTPLNLDNINPDKYVEDSTPLITYYEIPQALPTTLTLTVDVGGAITTRSFFMPDKAWSPDKEYIYYIHIDIDDGEIEPILINLTVEAFTYGGEIDEEQTNW